MPGKFSQELTVTFETAEDMQDWLDFIMFHSKRLRCPPQEVIGRLVAEWKKKGMEIESLEHLPKKIEKKKRKKDDDDDSDAPKILKHGPPSE